MTGKLDGMHREDFDGTDLDSGRWVPYYLPHWSSREAARATYAVRDSVLRLTIPISQGLWCGRPAPATAADLNHRLWPVCRSGRLTVTARAQVS